VRAGVSVGPVVIHVDVAGTGLQAAWLALAAVLLGAIITGAVTFWVARRKERADIAAEHQRHVVEVRRAARLIDADLAIAETAARTSIESRRWWYTSQTLTSEGWQPRREVIASEMSESAWQSVIVAGIAINDLQSARDDILKINRAQMAIDPATAAVVKTADDLGLDFLYPTTAQIPDDQAARIEPILKHLQAGRAALAPLTADEPPSAPRTAARGVRSLHVHR
jgi:hypothetical protein